MTAGGEAAFRHEALLYAGEDQFLAGTVPFVRDAVACGEPIMVAVSKPRARAIAAELDGDADGVEFVDMARIGQNPARIIPAWREFVSRRAAAAPLRGIGEPIWPERGPAELEECHHHESLLNLAFAGTPSFWLLCPYDVQKLDDETVQRAKRNHPFISDARDRRTSDSYVPPHEAAGPFDGLLPPPPRDAHHLSFTAHDLRSVREFVSHRASAAGLDASRAEDLVLAVNELATNSVLHAGGRGVLQVWAEPEALLCEVRDDGRLTDPLVGRQRPRPEQFGGRGLWLVNHLCDLVQIRSLPTGNLVRLHMALA